MQSKDASRPGWRPCFASSECEQGLTCDFGQSPSVCATKQSNRPPDAAIVPVIDADSNSPDADVLVPDAMPVPDAAVDAAVYASVDAAPTP